MKCADWTNWARDIYVFVNVKNVFESSFNSIDVAAARVSLLGFLVKVMRCRAQVLALHHQIIHGLSAFKQIL